MELKPQTGWKILSRLNDTGEVDYCGQYGEPGYNLEPGQVGVALANWWDIGIRRRDRSDKLVFGGKYPRIVEALSHLFQLEWNDEWMIDYESDKCYRVSGDSYRWMASVQWNDEICDWMTPDTDLDLWIEWACGSCQRALPSHIFTVEQIIAQGFTQWPDDETEFANGWYEGQDDDPRAITGRIEEQFGDGVEVLFYLTDVGQFDVHFTAYYRVDNSDEV